MNWHELAVYTEQNPPWPLTNEERAYLKRIIAETAEPPAPSIAPAVEASPRRRSLPPPSAQPPVVKAPPEPDWGRVLNFNNRATMVKLSDAPVLEIRVPPSGGRFTFEDYAFLFFLFPRSTFHLPTEIVADELRALAPAIFSGWCTWRMAGWCTSAPQNAYNGFDVSFPVKNLRLLIFHAGAGSTTCVARVAWGWRAGAPGHANRS
jgi:hypothetical protein